MNRRIIALRGRGGIGKTTTINLLADELVTRGWRRESRVFHGSGVDITDMYVGADGFRSGIASAGDNPATKYLQCFENYKTIVSYPHVSSRLHP